MNLFFRTFPPFFPKSNLLQNMWWHRLALVISSVFSLVLLVTAIFIAYFFVNQLTDNLNVCSIQGNRVPIAELGKRQKTKTSTDKNFIRDTQYDNLSDYEAGKAILRDYPVYRDAVQGTECWSTNLSYSVLFIAFLILLIGFSVPNIIYRTILFVAFGNKWKK